MPKKLFRWTYFIQPEGGGNIKIGKTNNPQERLRTLATSSPVPQPYRIVGLIDGNRETELHRKFHKHRSHGEWFRPVGELLKFIAREASHDLREYHASAGDLALQGTAVPVVAARKPRVNRNYFNKFFANDQDLWINIQSVNWDEHTYYEGREGTEGEDIDDMDEPSTPAGVMDDAVLLIEEEGAFVEGIGVNEAEDLCGFICGHCSSRHRFEVLEDLGRVAQDMDFLTGRWRMFALYWGERGQTGLELVLFSRRDIYPEEMWRFEPLEAFSLACVDERPA